MPLSIDACFYGNESRFINHSCSPNVKAIEIATLNKKQERINKIGIFTIKGIVYNTELFIDYNCDDVLIDIPEDVPCLCNDKE